MKILIYYHLEEHSSGRHLLQVLVLEDFAATYIAPPGGIQRVRELRNNIHNEAAGNAAVDLRPPDIIDLESGAYATS